MKQGSACVALRSDHDAVLCAFKRSPSKLASFQKKVVRIDDHLGAAYAGLTSDARVISDWMRTEALRSRHVYARPVPIGRLVSSLGDKAQVNTQNYGKRPYGVGFLVIGYEEGTGAKVYEASPDAANFEYYAHAIGARSQSAKTYFERVVDDLAECSLHQLIMHGLRALRSTVHQSQSQLELQKERDVNKEKLTMDNVTIAYVGREQPFVILDGGKAKPFLDELDMDTVTVAEDDVAMQAEQASAVIPDDMQVD